MTEQHDHIESIIWKFHGRQISEDELRFLESWLDNPANQEVFKEISRIYFAGSARSSAMPVDIDKAWAKVAYRTTESHKRIKRHTVLHSALLVAAMFIAGVFIWWLQQTATDIKEQVISYAAVDSSIQVILPDGSIVDLREGSNLEVLSGFDEEHRNLRLEGEAYFDVERNEQLPFRIYTELSLTEVLGTSFLLRESEEGNTDLIVYSGKVRFANSENSKFLILEKNQGARLDGESEIQDLTEEDLNPLHWKTRELVYRNANVSDVLDEIAMLFDLNISYNYEISGNCRFTGRFQEADAENVIEAVCESFNWQYFSSGSTIIINNKVCD